jgi:hypothetical protein
MAGGFARKLHARTRAARQEEELHPEPSAERHGASLASVPIRRPRAIARADQTQETNDLIAYWARLRGPRRYPSCAEIDRKVVSFFWPFSILFRISDGGETIEIDSSIDPLSSFQGGLARATDDDEAPQFALTEWIVSVARNAALQRQPVLATTIIPGPIETRTYRGVAVPFSEGETIDHVLAHYLPVDDD